MLTRCVVMVDAAYIRAATATQLTDDLEASAVLSDTSALVQHLRAPAEDLADSAVTVVTVVTAAA